MLNMGITYSTYEAKARFSEIIRHVRDGRTVTVSYRGEPVAEVRPIRERPPTIEERLEDLERRGVLVRSGEPRRPFKEGVHVPGALKRFLEERGE